MADVIGYILSTVLSIIAATVGTYLFVIWQKKKEDQPLRQLLNFGKDELLFVFPHRDEAPEAILPRTSTEDFLAMNNIISALLKIGWKDKIGVRDTGRVTAHDKKHNLVAVCSPKSNSFTKEVLSRDVLDKSGNGYASKVFRFEKIQDLDQWKIMNGTAHYLSRSYEQIGAYQQEGKSSAEIAEQEIDDVAMIAKLSNPWNPANKIVVIAGVRGIGTWGAAECIKKAWRQIYDLKKGSGGYKKDGDFAAILEVKYNNCDITGLRIHTLKDLS